VVHFNIIADFDKDNEKNDRVVDDDGEEERYNCPETGAHFEFLDMITRLKKL
jgi:hypothetical protein